MKSVLKKLLARKVLAGPFRGMRYLGTSSGSTLMPKILGTYEQELHPLLARLQPRLNHTVVVVGAAEGYYAVGLLREIPQLKVIAYEMSPEGRAALEKMAVTNGVRDRLILKEACEVAGLRQVLAASPADLVLMDVEGYENVLLDPVAVPELISSRVLVELHDFDGFKMADRLRERFSATHEIEHIPVQARSPEDIGSPFYRTLAKLVPRARHALLWERGDAAGWLHLVPRQGS